MKLRLLGRLCACMFTLTITQINAALVEVDWMVPGDKLLTLDTVTGLEWLDLTETTWITHKDMVGNGSSWPGHLAQGQQFEGFEYASRSTVWNFMNNAGVVGATGGFVTLGDPEITAAAMEFQRMVGATRIDPDGVMYSAGITSDFAISTYSGRLDWYYATWLLIEPNASANEDAVYIHPGSIVDEASSSSQFGNWIYRQQVQTVPIPPALYLFGSGLIGLVGVAKKA